MKYLFLPIYFSVLVACDELSTGDAGLVTQAFTKPIETVEISWRPGPGGYRYKLEIQNIDDSAALCMAVEFFGPMRNLSTQVLRRSYLSYNGRAVVEDFSFATVTPDIEKTASYTATCKSTGISSASIEQTDDWEVERYQDRFSG